MIIKIIAKRFRLDALRGRGDVPARPDEGAAPQPNFMVTVIGPEQKTAIRMYEHSEEPAGRCQPEVAANARSVAAAVNQRSRNFWTSSGCVITN